MTLLKRKYLNELFETQDFCLATQKVQRSTCHHLHMVANSDKVYWRSVKVDAKLKRYFHIDLY